ncbi:MAG: AAA family ATPase [Armatimonadetes bacterium]|nr:AAA family ATPase [Armatimonadota bacterium]
MSEEQDAPAAREPTLVTRVRLRNFRSIAACDVALGPLTILVGPNGSGKSNFLDALRFVVDALGSSLAGALNDRGGIGRRSTGHPRHTQIRLDLSLPDGRRGRYELKLDLPPSGRPGLQVEQLVLGGGPGIAPSHFTVVSGEVVQCSEPVPPAPPPDRLYLGNASGLPPFRLAYDCLSRMGFYHLDPARLSEVETGHQRDDLLGRDGANVVAVLDRLGREQPAAKERIEQYLRASVPGLEQLITRGDGSFRWMESAQAVQGARQLWRFPAASMSDGSLLAMGVLVALFQTTADSRCGVPLVGIEEPEAALHPFAAAVLYHALSEASHTKQVLVTTHSPDLLDLEEVRADSLVAVVNDGGSSRLGPVDEAAAAVLREQLFTPGELLRLSQLAPDAAPERQAGRSRLPRGEPVR